MAKGMAESAQKTVSNGARAAMNTALRSSQGWPTPGAGKTAAKTTTKAPGKTAAKPAVKAKPRAKPAAGKTTGKTPAKKSR